MKRFAFLSLLILSVVPLSAQQESKAPFIRDQGYFSVGINPIYPFLSGYGIKAYYNFPQHWTIGLSSEGAFDLPDFAVNQFFENGDQINVHWDYAVGVETWYRFRKKDNDIRGFYVSASLGYEGWNVRPQAGTGPAPEGNANDQFQNWFTSVGLGYNLVPFRKAGLWVGFSYNLIFLLNNTGDRTVGEITYNLRPAVPPSWAPNIYLGWRFGKSR